VVNVDAVYQQVKQLMTNAEACLDKQLSRLQKSNACLAQHAQHAQHACLAWQAVCCVADDVIVQARIHPAKLYNQLHKLYKKTHTRFR
jgi:hypothetical protein